MSNTRRAKPSSKSKEAQARAIISAQNSQSTLPELKNRLDRLNGVYEVRLIALTSNLFVQYDPKVITLDDLRSSIGK